MEEVEEEKPFKHWSQFLPDREESRDEIFRIQFLMRIGGMEQLEQANVRLHAMRGIFNLMILIRNSLYVADEINDYDHTFIETLQKHILRQGVYKLASFLTE